MIWPLTDSRVFCEVNGDYVAYRFEHLPAGTRHAQVAGEIDLGSGLAKVVAYPTGPMQEVRVVTRKPYQKNHSFHHCLLHGVHEGCMRARVSAIRLLRENKRRVRQRSVQLDDARTTIRRKITSSSDSGIWTLWDLPARPFQKRVPVRGENVTPWHLEKTPVKLTGTVIGISDHSLEDLMQFRLSTLYLVLLSQSFGRRTMIPIVRVELPMKPGHDIFKHGHRRPARPFRPGVPTEPAAHHDRCAPTASVPQCLGDVIHTELVRERHVSHHLGTLSPPSPASPSAHPSECGIQ